ncbi:DNA alkylation repair protein [Sediminicola luteus]|uniref:DNA alkylation repair protein n=1 Tax=Sediminicola luteus TaxID=319238 RepID=A0A2A4G6N7_9FLAO|nr:DNA alkylation repair protein [Sediminicola luteus]PCE64093.1 hypothetical protein B7P33_12730 [Sediminicola luteus]
MEPFKNLYNPTFVNRLAQYGQAVYPAFDPRAFTASIFTSDWEALELKQRMRRLSEALHEQFPKDFAESGPLLLVLVDHINSQGDKEGSIEYMFLPDFVEQYGRNQPELAFDIMEELTQFTSCEFAVRLYLIDRPEVGMKRMRKWSTHPNLHVRRLASEGCRPRLPWAMALPFLKKDPSPILPILERLKSDASEYVRRSVANNLNDISKDHPELALEIATQWKGLDNETDWVAKHGSRTLLKQGNPKAMALFGLGHPEGIEISGFTIHTPKIEIGDYLEFSLHLSNTTHKTRKLRLEYGLYYLKANGTHSRKVFKISEKEYAGQTTVNIQRRQSFKPITTRVFHKGHHKLSPIINGVEFEPILEFELL